MPIDRSQFQIQVVTTADTAALEKTIATLNEVKKTEAALGHDTSQIEQILDVKNAELDKAKAAEEAGKKQVKAAEDTTLSHRELREAVSAVGRQFGGLADVGLWLNPTTAALAALLAAVEGVKKVFEQLQAPVDAFNAEMLALDDSKLKSAAESASGMSESLSDIVNTEKKLQAAYESGTTAMDHRIKKYGEEQDAILKVEEAREKAFEAEIDLLAKSGAISKEEADRRKEQAQLQLDSDRGAIDQKKLRFEIDLRSKTLADAKTRVDSGADEKARADAEKAEAKPAADYAAAQAEAKSAAEAKFDAAGMTDKTLAEYKKAAQENSAKMEDFERQAASPIREEAAAGAEGVAYVQRQAAALNEAIRARDKYNGDFTKEVDLTKAAVDAAKNNTAIAAEQEKHDKETIRTAPDQLAALQDQYALQQKTNAAVQAANTQATAAKDAAARAGTTDQAKDRAAAAEAREKAANESNAGNPAAQNAAAHESGPQAALDANASITKSRLILSQVASQPSHKPTAAQDAELHELLDTITGLLLNHAQEMNSQRRSLSDLKSKLETVAGWAGRNRNVG